MSPLAHAAMEDRAEVVEFLLFSNRVEVERGEVPDEWGWGGRGGKRHIWEEHSLSSNAFGIEARGGHGYNHHIAFHRQV